MVLKTLHFNGHTIEIVRGDITQEKTEAIVNAANSSLQHGGGVALAIVRAAGGKVTEESREYIKQNGEVPTGSAMVTSGGNLNADYIIHAVGPVWGSGGEDEKLRQAIESSLAICDEYALTSCAFPAISSGIFGFPNDRCADIFLKTLNDYFAQNPDTPLEQVRLCNIDEATSAVFKEKADQYDE